MAKLVWDQTGEKLYETGVKMGVLYPQGAGGSYPKGVPWNGLTAVTESPSGAEATPLYADDIKYLNLMSTEEFGATIEAYTYPDEFAKCDGSAEIATGVTIGQQKRQAFGLAYRTVLGNDTEANSYAYKHHLIYGALAAPSEKAYATINDSPEAITFSWGVSTTPVSVNGFEPTASLVIDSSKVDKVKLAVLEAILYGVDADEYSETKTYAIGEYCQHSSEYYVCSAAVETAGAWDASKWTKIDNPGARLPLPDEVAAIMGTNG